MHDDAYRRIVRSREIPDRLIRDLQAAPLIPETDIARFAELAGARAAMPLTEREIQVLRALGDGGLHRSETAVVLGCTLETVKEHLKAVKAKLGAKTTAQAVARAIRQELI